MATDAYTLAVGVDSSGVRQGARDLAEFSGAAAQAARVGAELGKVAAAHATAIIAAVSAYLAYADALDEMSERTGIAADKLAGLEYVAAQTGTSLQSLVELLGRMTDKASDAANGSERAQRVFETMGVKVVDVNGVLRSQEELLGDVADKFKGYADGSAKVALAQELFGRGGRQLIPLLNQGRDGLAAMTAEYQSLGGLTSDAARRMGAFNDQLAATQIQAKSLTGQFTLGLLPALEDLLRFVRDMAPAAEDANALGAQLGEWMKELMPYAYRLAGGFQAVGTAIGGAAAAVGLALRGEFRLALQTMRDIEKDIGKLETDLEARLVEATRNAAQRLVEDRGFTPGRGGETAPGVAAGRASAARVKALKEENEAVVALNKTMAKYADLLVELEGPEAKFKRAVTELIPLIETFGLAEEDVLKIMGELRKEMESAPSWLDEATQGQIGVMEAAVKATDAVEAQAKALEDEARYLGLSKTAAYEAAIAQLELQKRLIGTYEAYEGQVAEIDAQIAAYRRLIKAQQDLDAKQNELDTANKAKEQWTSFFEQVDRLAFDTFTNVFENGKNAFEALANTIRSTLMAALYQLVVRPWVINIVASLTGQGGVAAQLLSGAGGGGGVGSLFGNLLGGGSGGSGILGSLGSLIGGLGGNFFGGMGGALGNLGIEGLFAGTAGNFSAAFTALSAGNILGGIGTMIGAALPIIGIGLMLAPLLGDLFGGGGGPKGGGFAFAGKDLGLERFFTPNSNDADVRKIVDATLAKYDELLSALGGKGEATFAAGFDTDPEGTANNRAVIEAYVDGVLAYRYKSGDDALGRDADALKETLDLEAKRALLAALQASDLPDAVAAILDSVAASTATVEQIEEVVAFAQAFQGLMAIFKDTDVLAAGIAVFDRASMSIGEVLADAGKELRALADKFDGTAASAQDLAAATEAYKQAAIEAVAQIQALRVGIAESFDQLRDQLTITMLGGKDDDGNALYAFYQQRADELREQLRTEQDPARIAQIVSQIQQYSSAAFSILSPAEQATQLQTFLDNLAEVERLADERLADIQETIADAATQTLNDIKTLLDKFIEDLTAANAGVAKTQEVAADKQLLAANKQLTAASTPITVLIPTSEVTG